MQRRKTRPVQVGPITIGGGAPIVVQSMVNTKTHDVEATVAQINELEQAGCELVRLAIPDRESAQALARIRPRVNVPLAADIHFDHRLALMAIEHGVDKLRINPGNIGSTSKVKEVVQAARDQQTPIRIGVNSGSLAAWAVEKHGRTAEAMVESALEHVRILENLHFEDIVLSMKATDIHLSLQAYELMSSKVDYPLHLGITEAGTLWFGTIKSAAGLGALLSRGIGDTLRVSLTAHPVEEVKVAWALLESMDLRRRGPLFISCPTCGRTEIPLEQIAIEVQERLANLSKPITIAVMGCPVNGPGEAREADLGIAGGHGHGLIFRRGEVLRKVPQEDIVDALIDEAQKWASEDEEVD